VSLRYYISVSFSCTSAESGNFEVPVYFLKAKQGYTIKKMGKDKWM
jgi:hypothetical protein